VSDERVIGMAAVGVLLIALGLASEGDLEAYESQATNYCEMVDMHRSSGGENGWPDYRGNYAEVCE